MPVSAPRIKTPACSQLARHLGRSFSDQHGSGATNPPAVHWLRRLVFEWGGYLADNAQALIPIFSVFVFPAIVVAGALLYTLEEEFKIQILDKLGVWLMLDDVSGKHKGLVLDQPRKDEASVYPRIEGDEIRLLILAPGRWDSPLSCRLVRCRSSDALSYEALSYTWENEDRVHDIECNGEPFPITENLESALRHLRHPYGRRILWVDAVCIDQSDMDERSQQVRRMKEIYSQARRVVVWLGPETVNVRGAFVFNAFRGYVPGPEGVALKEPRFDFSMDQTAVSIFNKDLDPLVALMERSWFRRVWILQEAALAKEAILHCGKRRTRWETFSATLAHLKRKGVVLDRFTPRGLVGVDAVLGIEEIRAGSQQNLLWILLATSSAECSDLRDKVFGVLSLAKDYEPRRGNQDGEPSFGNIEPDYTATVAEVFTRLAQWSIHVYGAPDILSCTSRTDVEPSAELGDLPSWVPDWTRLGTDTPFMRYSFCAISQREPLFESEKPVVLNGKSLDVPAVLVDKIKQVGCQPQFKKTPFGRLWREDDEGGGEPSKVILGVPKWTDGNSRAMLGAQSWMADCENILRSASAGGHIATQEEAPRRIWKTLVAGMDRNGEPTSDAFGRYFLTYRKFLDACIGTQRLGDADIMVPQSLVNVVAQVEAALHMWSSKRRFAVTQKGRMALVPNRACEGDLVVWVSASRVPHILRQKGDGTFSVLGEAYLDDMQSCQIGDQAVDEMGTERSKYETEYYRIT